MSNTITINEKTYTIVEFPSSTHTAQQAADSIGCTVAQIAKSIVFKVKDQENGVLVVTSGINRVDTKKVETILNLVTEKADADFVKRYTGYTIGGVSPINHKNKMIILLDEDLKHFEEIWASAGTSNTVFKLNPEELKEITGSEYYDVKLINN